MPASFLSPSNAEHLLRICMQYMGKVHNVRLSDKRCQSFLVEAMRELHAFYQEHPPFPPLEDMNKRAIVNVKERSLLWVREQMPRPPPPPHVPSSDMPSSNVSPVPAPAIPEPMGESLLPSPAPSEMAPPEDQFLQRLQELELQRSAMMATPLAPSMPPTSVVTPPAPVAPPASLGPTVLYVPTMASTSRTHTMCVHGLQRPWHYFTPRATLVWNGEVGIQGDTVCLSCVMLPWFVRMHTPLVQVRVLAVGQQEIRVHVTCEPRGTCGAGWDAWKPTSPGSALLPKMAWPWTLHVEDIEGEPLALGDDGWNIEQAVPMPGGNTKWVLSGAKTDWIEKGHTLVCEGEPKPTRHRILLCAWPEVVVEGDHGDRVGRLCALWEGQVSFVFELAREKK